VTFCVTKNNDRTSLQVLRRTYKVMILKISDLLLSIIFTSINSHYLITVRLTFKFPA